jgi:hypothetical protein
MSTHRTLPRRRNPRFIGRCANCGATRAIDAIVAEPPAMMGWPARDEIVVRVMAGGQPVSLGGGGPDRSYFVVGPKGVFKHTVVCPCGGRVTFRAVHGVYDPSVKCDKRCWGARGQSCTCECGGNNHGASFGSYRRSRSRR